MAPKRAPAAKKKRHEEEEEVVVDSDEEDEQWGGSDAKKRKAPAKKKEEAAPKKPKAEKVNIKDFVAGEDGGEVAASPKAKKPKPVKVTEPTELEDGFTAHPPSLLYKAFGEQSTSTKIAAFDFDGTLVQTKSTMQFPLNARDWVFYNDEVVPKLQQYHQEGYRIAIFTNQGGIKSALTGQASLNFRQRVALVLQQVQVPAVVLAATLKDELRKPDRGMWDFFVKHFMQGQEPDLASSFFVGDNIDEGDVGFANAVGLTYRSEREEFGEKVDPKAEGGGGSGAPQGPVEVQGTGQGPNAELINMFQTLSELKRTAGDKSSAFAANALKKVASILQELPFKVTEDRLKEISNLKGVGKASIDKIKEYLATGTFKALSGQDGDAAPRSSSLPAVPAGKEGKQLESKGRQEALQFM